MSNDDFVALVKKAQALEKQIRASQKEMDEIKEQLVALKKKGEKPPKKKESGWGFLGGDDDDDKEGENNDD